MDKIKINIRSVVCFNICFDLSEAQKIFELIDKAFKGWKVVLSFANIDIIHHSFLNVAIGQLYNIYSEDFIKEHLIVENMSQQNMCLLKKVVDNAKLYYKNCKDKEFVD